MGILSDVQYMYSLGYVAYQAYMKIGGNETHVRYIDHFRLECYPGRSLIVKSDHDYAGDASFSNPSVLPLSAASLPVKM
jgi:hypothetical protein